MLRWTQAIHCCAFAARQKKKQIFVLPNHMTLPQQLHDKGNATILLEGLGWSGYLDDPRQ